MGENDASGETGRRAAFIGGAFVLVILVIIIVTCNSRTMRHKKAKAKAPARPLREGVEFDISDLFGPRDLELGIVRPERARLPDPDMFVIREEDEEESNRRESKGKGKSVEVGDEDDKSSSSSDPFDLSYYLSAHAGSQAAESATALLGPDGVLPTAPSRAMTKGSRGHSVSRRTVCTGSSAVPAPSQLANPSRFVIVDTDVSSDEEKDVNRWRPAPPKASRYRGLSATRRSQLPRTDRTKAAAAQRTAEAAPLPAPEVSYFGGRRDSWGFLGTNDYAVADPTDSDHDEWTSEVFTSLTGATGLATGAKPATEIETETGRAASGPSGQQYPAWEHGGPLVPDSRILEQKASLAGREAKFVEVDLDGSSIEAPAGMASSDVFRDCANNGQERASVSRPGMARWMTWGASVGGMFWRRRDRDASSGPSRPEAAARSKTSWV